MSLGRRARNAVKRRWKAAFTLGQRLGVDVLPRHFYSSVPDFCDLKGDDRWRKPYDLHGILGRDLDGQEQEIRRWMSVNVYDHLRANDVLAAARDEQGEGGYGDADGDALFAFIATNRPAKILQVGCGASTALILAAARFAGYAPELCCIEPFPSDYLVELEKSGQIRLIAEKAEHVTVDEYLKLASGDLLFIDSTHATRPGSDVHHLILRVLPRLCETSGINVHVHDTQLPYDFGPNLMGPGDLFFGGESTLLQAFLTHNPRCGIACSLPMLHHGRPDLLAELLPHYTPVATNRGLNPPDHYGQTPSATYLLTQ